MARATRAGWVACRGSCDGCAAEWTARNAQALAALHHDRTGHVTRVEKVLAVVYGTPLEQASLEGLDSVTGDAAAV